ncbi:MAG: glycosyltransferase [Cellulomonas sp.]|nr:glycosyltransferase [Cellulomonas sp.]OJV82134.1 MAG: glycosyl transferase [Cellulomonas sp. 73-92]
MTASRRASDEGRTGVVSVVLVNYKGADDTIACLRSLTSLDWPAERLEMVVVDNASSDGSAARIRDAVPGALVVESPSNTGFAGGCNLGVAHATGEYVAFLNNDARADRSWLTAAVATLESDDRCGAVACKVLDWDGKLVDYVGAALTWYGMGYKPHAERPDSTDFDRPRDVLFATGAAMVMRAGVYREVGGFDERFFMFYEDVDLGWRLNLLGWRVRYEPRSIAFHKHHATMAKFGSFRERYLLERNALMAMYKNYDDETLTHTLPAALMLAVRRALAMSGTDSSVLDLERSPGGDDKLTLELDKTALTSTFAIDGFVGQLSSLEESRRDIQARRRRSDRELFPLFRDAFEPAYGMASYVKAHDELVDAFGIAEHLTGGQRILVVTGEPLLEKMAGPAIRAWEIAKALADEHDVWLVSTGGCRVSSDTFRVSSEWGDGLSKALEWADVIVFQGLLLEVAPWLAATSKILVADLYDPMHLEQLEQAKDLPPGERELAVADATRVLNETIARADFMLCASEKQRDFWLGQLAGQGRVNPAVYDEDQTLASLLAVVPFGVSDEPPVQRRHAIRGAVPGIGMDDKVILWGGGLYNWFDPLTLVRAVAALDRKHDDVRLFFLGMSHPNPGVPKMRVAWETRQLADELGLTDRVVFFNEGWVAYDERADYLLDANIGVSTHFTHVETTFSFRTRMLDYLWASLPIVATEGDTFADLIASRGLGRVVPARDVDELAAALEEMLYDRAAAQAARENVTGVVAQFRWSAVLRPLVAFSRSPRRAADLPITSGSPMATARVRRPVRRLGLVGSVRLAGAYFRVGGLREVSRRVTGRVKRQLSGRS